MLNYDILHNRIAIFYAYGLKAYQIAIILRISHCIAVSKINTHKPRLTPYNRLQIASILHLLDLKRAGHSPSNPKIELNVISDGTPYKSSAIFQDIYSSIGSAANNCVEN